MSNNPKFTESYILDKNFPPTGPAPGARASRQPPLNDLGNLQLLPVELILNILSRLDLRSVANVSYTNRQMLRVCESDILYGAIMKHAQRAIFYILTSDVGDQVLIQDLHDALLNPQCGTCDAVAGYYDIFSGQRICHSCLRKDQSEHKRLHPLRYDNAMGAYALPAHIMDSLPHMRTMPGRPHQLDHPQDVHEPITMFSCEAARAAGIIYHGSEAAMEEAALVERMRQHGTSREDETRMSECRVCYAQHRAYYMDRIHDHALYWLSIMRMPYLNRQTGEAEESFHCPGCLGYPFSQTPEFRREFFVPSYEKHVELLGPVLIRWNDKHHLLKGETSDSVILQEISDCYVKHAESAEVAG